VNAELGDASRPDSVDEGIAAAISEHRFRDVIFLCLIPREICWSIGHLPIARDARKAPPARIDRRFAAASCNGARYVQVRARRGATSTRSYVRHFRSTSRRPRCFVLQSLHRQNEFLETLAGTFWIVIPLAILFAGVAGIFLARRSLSPVVVMGATGEPHRFGESLRTPPSAESAGRTRAAGGVLQ